MVQQGEIDFGGQINERPSASYFPKNFASVAAADRWRLLDGEAEILPGITAVLTPGHVPYHQSVKISDGGETACFLGDVVPTTAPLRLPIMGFDLEPLVTLESKRRLLTEAEAEGWILVFEHDPAWGVGRAIKDGKSFEFKALES